MRVHNLVIGFPLEHTLSPVLHNAAYADLGLDADMQAHAHEDLAFLVDKIRRENIQLTAVTMPHKQRIMPLLDVVDPVAQSIGAVNTVIHREGVLTGYNTDIVGIEWALRERKVTGQPVVVLGAGGAARPVCHWAQQQGAQLYIVNRSAERAHALAQAYDAQVTDEASLAKRQPALIVNATPLGMAPHEGATPLTEKTIKSLGSSTFFDLVYRPQATPFLTLARQNGAHAISGLDLFVAQALAQIELWSGHKLPTERYLNRLKNHEL